MRRKNAQACKVKAIGQSEHTARGNAQVSPRVRRRNAQTCKVNGNNDSQISAAIDESVTDTKTSESHANAKCSNHADCANPGMERRHSEKCDTSYEYGTSLDRNTPKRSVLKSRLANIIDRYGNQLMRYASANKQIVTGGIAGSTRGE